MNQFLSYISFKDKERPAEEIFMTAKLGAVLVRLRAVLDNSVMSYTSLCMLSIRQRGVRLCLALVGAESVSAQH